MELGSKIDGWLRVKQFPEADKISFPVSAVKRKS
jgi:hypothetical protein